MPKEGIEQGTEIEYEKERPVNGENNTMQQKTVTESSMLLITLVAETNLAPAGNYPCFSCSKLLSKQQQVKATLQDSDTLS